jgi:hypothetical protein
VAFTYQGEAYRVVYNVTADTDVWGDLGYKNADVAQLKALLAAAIIKEIERQGLIVACRATPDWDRSS